MAAWVLAVWTLRRRSSGDTVGIAMTSPDRETVARKLAHAHDVKPLDDRWSRSGSELVVMGRIAFYRASERPYGAFSNLFRRPVTVAGTEFPTVEHAYQSLKPRDPRVRAWLLAAPAPSLVAIAAHVLPSDEPDPSLVMGRAADSLLGFHTRPGWSRLRYPWMLQCLDAKFDQHQDLGDLLLATGSAEIVEAGTIDDEAGRRWGIVNGRGCNYLGRMLTRVRAKLSGRTHPDADLDVRLAFGADALATALLSNTGGSLDGVR